MNGSQEPPAPTRVLLVEHDAELADGLVTFLRAHGMTVNLARDGTDGLVQVRNEHFDIAVIEMLLPGASGFILAQTIRATHGELLPIVMVSDSNASEHREYAAAIGVTWFLPKPFTPQELLSDIHTLLTPRP